MDFVRPNTIPESAPGMEEIAVSPWYLVAWSYQYHAHVVSRVVVWIQTQKRIRKQNIKWNITGKNQELKIEIWF